jgi:hypothetical protein
MTLFFKKQSSLAVLISNIWLWNYSSDIEFGGHLCPYNIGYPDRISNICPDARLDRFVINNIFYESFLYITV